MCYSLCFVQSGLKAFSHLAPPRFFQLGPFFDRGAILFNLGRGCLVLPPCGFQRRLGICHSRVTARADLRRRSLFFLALPFSPLPFSFVSECGPARSVFVSLGRLWCSLAARGFAFTWTRTKDSIVGRSACSRKGWSEPTGRRKTIPGFAIAAATTSPS